MHQLRPAPRRLAQASTLPSDGLGELPYNCLNVLPTILLKLAEVKSSLFQAHQNTHRLVTWLRMPPPALPNARISGQRCPQLSKSSKQLGEHPTASADRTCSRNRIPAPHCIIYDDRPFATQGPETTQDGAHRRRVTCGHIPGTQHSWHEGGPADAPSRQLRRLPDGGQSAGTGPCCQRPAPPACTRAHACFTGCPKLCFCSKMHCLYYVLVCACMPSELPRASILSTSPRYFLYPELCAHARARYDEDSEAEL